ncbi:MAG: VWA domain-containing protein [Candidatus Liberibacter ctenarytainae]|uniref:VWA domain-containing protein n=1 Tax=Candidatus Liberibacter ctenarytainae TaxID=2020335 RepID=A0A937AEX7_9HYPH|nr:VWA domain-containing protein [Candidatus Liberibacter ctenarytainae]
MFFLRTKGCFRHNIGNFAILTAILLPILIIIAFFIFHIAHIIYTKTLLQNAVNHALATAAADAVNDRVIDLNAVKASAKRDFLFHLKKSFSVKDTQQIINNMKISIKETEVKGRYLISLNSPYRMNFKNMLFTNPSQDDRYHTSLLAHGSIFVQLKSDFAASIMLVVDVSGSMMLPLEDSLPKKAANPTAEDLLSWSTEELLAWPITESKIDVPLDDSLPKKDTSVPTLPATGKRIDIAKESIGAFLDDIGKIPQVNTAIRIGLATFSDHIVDKMHMGWGVNRIRKQISLVKAFGMTDSFPPMEYAYNTLFEGDEDKKHRKYGHNKFNKYIIFMTDGDNINPESNETTLRICQQVKDKGGIIYGIAVHMKKKKFIQACASKGQFYSVDRANEFVETLTKISRDIRKKSIWFNE